MKGFLKSGGKEREIKRGGAIHEGISHGRRRFTTKNVSWIRSLERMLQWRKRKRERKREGGGTQG